ncbi:MAG: M6 family metalloprotease domain-containing protein [Muribaculaceae bacterium]|nr:M6 family metalloprotease domain-containing protein [Muribaculaceae bacterium]
MEGYLLAPCNEGWHYLINDSIGGVKVSDISLDSPVSVKQREKLVNSGSNPLYSPHKNTIRRSPRLSISSGISNALIILVEFPDLKFTKTTQEMTDLFNKIGYDEDGAKGSVRDFYRYASYGGFDLVSNVYGPYVTVHPTYFYGGNNAYGNDINVPQLVVEAIEKLPDDIDLSIYDNDNDGSVDNVHIIFAGHGEEAGATSSAIWSHEYPHPLPVTKNGFKFAGYSCSPELRSNFGSRISRIGVICHELGHAFGANDFYDVDYSSNGAFDGTGVWDLMASGSWNDNGISPANFNPYVKSVEFGWVDPITPEKSGSFTLSAYNDYPEVLKIPTSYPDEYYLMEYRARRQFDEGLPGEGIMIYHVHPHIESRLSSNTINNTHPQYLYPVCASCAVSPVYTSDYGNINTPECPFPGSTGNSNFTQAFQWYGGEHPFSIKNIKFIDNTAYCDIYFSENEPINPDTPNSDSLSYCEDFENGLKNFLSQSIEGTTIWEVYPTQSLSLQSNLPTPYEGEKALMLYDGAKTNQMSTSYLTSELITLSADSIHTLSFWMKTVKRPASGHHSLNVSMTTQNSSAWKVIYESSDMIDEWSEITIPLPIQLSSLRLRFSGSILGHGIFIDDIKIIANTPAGIADATTRVKNINFTYNPLCITSRDLIHVMIHDIYGNMVFNAKISPSETLTPALAKGAYIISTDTGERYKVFL